MLIRYLNWVAVQEHNIFILYHGLEIIIRDNKLFYLSKLLDHKTKEYERNKYFERKKMPTMYLGNLYKAAVIHVFNGIIISWYYFHLATAFELFSTWCQKKLWKINWMIWYLGKVNRDYNTLLFFPLSFALKYLFKFF